MPSKKQQKPAEESSVDLPHEHLSPIKVCVIIEEEEGVSDFNLETRAEELFIGGTAWGRNAAQSQALQLAREALEAAAKECEAQADRLRTAVGIGAYRGAADIIRSIANERPGVRMSDYAADTLDGMGQPYEQDTMSHEKPGAPPRVEQRPAPATTEPPASLAAAERALVNRGLGPAYEKALRLEMHASVDGFADEVWKMLVAPPEVIARAILRVVEEQEKKA